MRIFAVPLVRAVLVVVTGPVAGGAVPAAASPAEPVAGRQLISAPAAVSAAGYGPADLQAAYNLQSAWSGMRETVAVVGAFDYPTAEADLAIYRANYGLPACTTSDGCLRVLNQTGSASPLPGPDASWAAASAADLDMVSAICPNCRILLVEANSTAMTDMGPAVNTATAHGASAVDIGWSVAEFSGETTYDSTYFNHTGVAIVAPAAQAAPGATGYGLIGYPAASPHGGAVGGTTLINTGTGPRGWSETAWAQSGSGCSAYETKPTRQTDTGCGGKRTLNDVAADADPTLGSGAVATYDSYGDSTLPAPRWAGTGGTSVAAAIITSTYALTGTPRAGTYPTDYPYAHSTALYDTAAGSTGTCTPAYLCTTGSGYDAPTGMGTPAFTLGFDYSGAHGGAVYSGVFGKCIDDNKSSTTNGNPIAIFSCNGGANQNWTFHADGTIQILGKCMDVTQSGTTNGTKVELYTCNTTGAQQWRVRGNGQLLNPHSGRCLDDPGASTTNNTQLVIDDCRTITTATGQTAVPDERWTVPFGIPTSTGPVVSGVDANLCLDDLKAATTDGNIIDIFTCNGSTAQSWTITSNGQFQILGSCLDVNKTGAADGTKIDLWTCNGTGAQQWRELSDGSLLNPQSGKCLDDPGATTIIRTQLQLATCTGTAEQRWNLP